MGKSTKPPPATPKDQPSVSPRGKPELIVIIKPDLGLRARRGGLESAVGMDVQPLAGALDEATLQPLFGPSEERVQMELRAAPVIPGSYVPDLTRYYHVQAPEDQLAALAESLDSLDQVEAAYVKPAGEPPRVYDLAPSGAEPPANTPSFTPRQGYLDEAPGGINARFAWTVPGGKGKSVSVIDLEWAWRFDHEDLQENKQGVVAGQASGDANHGTAVLGVFSGDDNTFGITGISPEATVSAVSFSLPTAQAIKLAADRLDAGDIMLLEIHRPGPRFGYQERGDQRGYIPIEWWPDDFDAIRYAVSRGIIVVEAGGNGSEDLDDPIYTTQRPAAFGPNPWDPANSLDSGAILVGAGNPPAGIHGRNAEPHSGEPYIDRARCGFSNYGARVDVQGWGWEVTSCGYGDLQGGQSEILWYTDQFSGTSSASPTIVGALACIQGVLRAHNAALLTPARARQLLRETGSPQQDAPGRPSSQRIGNRPDLRALLNQVLGPTTPPPPLAWSTFVTGTVAGNTTRTWITDEWPATLPATWRAVPHGQSMESSQLTLKVSQHSAANGALTYMLDVTNSGATALDVDLQYQI